MKKDAARQPPDTESDCHRTRLAQSRVAAVDVCDCGAMQLHLGALTVRMSQAALSELLSTLGQAVARHAALRHGGTGVHADDVRPESPEAHRVH